MNHDNNQEMFPLVDEQGNITGAATRGECHNGSKLLHPVIHLHVFNSKGAREKELVFVHKTVYDGEIHPSDELDGGRFWSPDEIKANIGKGVFTPNFEGEIGKVINL